MSTQTVLVENPDGTTTEVTMVCVQDRDGNVVRGSNGKADQRYCNFGGGGAAAPLIHLGPLALDTTQIGILLVVVALVVALLFF